MSDFATELGRRIRQLRTEKHMSQEELAFKAGLSAAHLGQIERAIKNPTVDTVGKIAGALGVSAASLFSDRVQESTPRSNVIDKIHAHLISMDEGEQKDLLRIIRILRNYGHNDS